MSSPADAYTHQVDPRMTDTEVLNQVRAAFSVVRPEQFTDRAHCCECAEHDDLLRSRNLDTLTLEDIGHPGWDPLCFATNDGFLYYFPALAWIALDKPSAGYGWYFEQLLFHLTYEGSLNRRLVAMSSRQREAVVLLLRHVQATRSAAVTDNMCDDDLQKAIETWTNTTGTKPKADEEEAKVAHTPQREK